MPPKKSKRENNSKWSGTKPKSKLKRRLASDIVKEIPGSRVDVRLVKNDLEASLLYINENMITKIVERANDQMRKVRKKINGDEFLFHCSDANKRKLNVCFDCFILEASTTIRNIQQKSSSMTRFLQEKYTG